MHFRFNFILGTRGDDDIVGTDGRELILARHGADTVRPGAGNDRAFLGSGNDIGIYNIDANLGFHDFYSGGRGHDILKIEVSSAQLAAIGGEAVIQDFFDANQSHWIINFSEIGFDLRVHSFEELIITITDSNESPAVAPTAMDSGAENMDVVYSHAELLTLIQATDDQPTADLVITVNNVQNGSINILDDGDGNIGDAGDTFTFIPNTDFFGDFTFNYKVTDVDGAMSGTGVGTLDIAEDTSPPPPTVPPTALDAVVINSGLTDAAILTNSPDGTLVNTGSISLGGIPTAVAVGNFIASSGDDIALTHGNTLSVFNGTTLSETTIDMGIAGGAGSADTSNITTADLTGNGLAEIIVANAGLDDIQIYNTTVSGLNLVTEFDLGTGADPSAVAVGELSAANSSAEIVVSNAGFNNVQIHNSSTGALIDTHDLGAGAAPTGVAVGNVAGDGASEIIVTNASNTQVLSFNDTDGFGVITTLGITASAIAIGDLDGDGLEDIVLTNASNNTVSIVHGGDFTIQTFSVSGSPVDVAVHDLNNDGHLDIAVVNASLANSVEVFFNPGDGDFSTPDTMGVNLFSSNYFGIAFGDLG